VRYPKRRRIKPNAAVVEGTATETETTDAVVTSSNRRRITVTLGVHSATSSLIIMAATVVVETEVWAVETVLTGDMPAIPLTARVHPPTS
jgi:hypothetical protein